MGVEHLDRSAPAGDQLHLTQVIAIEPGQPAARPDLARRWFPTG